MVTLQFQKSIDSPKLSLAKGQTSEFIRILATGDWSSLKVSAYNGGPLMKVETDGGLTVVFEVFDTRPRKTLCFYDVCLAEYADRTIQRILKQKILSYCLKFGLKALSLVIESRASQARSWSSQDLPFLITSLWCHSPIL